jgi:hypothetical protein
MEFAYEFAYFVTRKALGHKDKKCAAAKPCLAPGLHPKKSVTLF